MDTFLRKEHWEKVFREKKPTEVSWYQPVPKTSLDLINDSKLSKDAAIIDVGCGDSFLIDFLLDAGYTNLYALDISAAALERAQARLGSKAGSVNWIEADVTTFEPEIQFDFWHDRAAFHFLTDRTDIANYKLTVTRSVKGYMSIGTFSDRGPLRCSGLFIKQYSEKDLMEIFNEEFDTLKCFRENHTTPSASLQAFTFCLFRKK